MSYNDTRKDDLPLDDAVESEKLNNLIGKYETILEDDDSDDTTRDSGDSDKDLPALSKDTAPSSDDILLEVDRIFAIQGIRPDDSLEDGDQTQTSTHKTVPKSPDEGPLEEGKDLASPDQESNRSPALTEEPIVVEDMRIIYDADDRTVASRAGRYPPVERFSAEPKAAADKDKKTEDAEPSLTGMRIIFESDNPVQEDKPDSLAVTKEDQALFAENPVSKPTSFKSDKQQDAAGLADLFHNDEKSEGRSASKKKSKATFFPRRSDSIGEKIRKTVLILSLITMLICGGFLLETYIVSPYLSNRQAEKTIQIKINSNTDTDWSQTKDKYADIDFPEGMQLKFAALYVQNKDFAGWLEIPGTGIDMPVVQGKDNAEYLKKDFLGEKSKYACVFVDSANNIKDLDRNTILYGHNMRYDDLMFGMLIDYRTPEGYKAAPIIEFNTLYSDHLWKIYAVFLTNSRNKDDNGYVFNYIFKNLSSDEAFSSYIAELDSRKLYTTGVDILPTDKLLTLSTCAYTFENARLAVVARMVRPGESADVDLDAVTLNPNPRYPQAWYTRYGKANPFADADRWFPS